MQQTPGRPVRDGAAAPEPAGHPRRHVGLEHVRPAGVHVQGGGARVPGLAVQLPEGGRVPTGEGTQYRAREAGRGTECYRHGYQLGVSQEAFEGKLCHCVKITFFQYLSSPKVLK